MKTDSKLALAPRRAARFNLLFILIILFGTLGFASCVTVDPVPPGLGVVLDQELHVVHVEPGGAADLGGIRPGDLLKKLNDRDLTTPNQARNVFHRAGTLKPITVVILREKNEITLQVQPTPFKGILGAKTLTPVPPDLVYF